MGDRRLTLQESLRANPTTVGAQLRELRKGAGLSQRALAQRVGTAASVICRLENEDYSGHSLDMLRRIAAVFGMRVEVQFVPDSSDKRREEPGALPSGGAPCEETVQF